VRLGDTTWPDVAALSSDVVVLVPLGSVEQHGRHLPLATDALIADALAGRVETLLPDRVLLLPTMWVGYAPHHRGFPGTLSAPWDVYVRLLEAVIGPLVESGLRRFLLLNAHAGNECPAKIALRELRRQFCDTEGLWLTMLSDWTVAKDMLHACEVETSLVLFLRPTLVHMERASAEVRDFRSSFYSLASDQPDRVFVAYAFDREARTGALGKPETASAERGRALFEGMVEETVAFVREFSGW
jgi:creatinine amidohydrolase